MINYRVTTPRTCGIFFLCDYSKYDYCIIMYDDNEPIKFIYGEEKIYDSSGERIFLDGSSVAKVLNEVYLAGYYEGYEQGLDDRF